MPPVFTRRAAMLASSVALLAPAAARPRTRSVRAPSVDGHLPALARLIAGAMKRTGVPGLSIAVVNDDRVVYLEGFGVRQAGRAEPVDADTVFALASLSKPIATTVVAGLVGDGVVSFDDKIVRYLPDFALSDPWITRDVTLRDMFCHRSGLPDHAGDLVEDIGYGREEVLHRLRYVKHTGDFRASYAYTNYGFTAAAVAAAKAAGKSWEDLCVARLYEPLGMTRSSSRYADFSACANRAFGHIRKDDAWIVGVQREPDAQSPAGGVSSSARDVAAWMRLLLGGGALDSREIIRAAALAETHRPEIVSAPARDPAHDAPDFYGLGWNVTFSDRPIVRWSHSGAFALGAATCVNILPAEKLGIVVLTNSSPIGVPEAICRSFVDLVMTGRIEKDWFGLYGEAFAKMAAPGYGRAADYLTRPLNAMAPVPLADYIGAYHSQLYGPIEFAADGERLRLTMGPGNTHYPLDIFDRDIFLFQPRGENAGGRSRATFTRNGNEKADSVLIDYLNENGQGSFMRS